MTKITCAALTVSLLATLACSSAPTGEDAAAPTVADDSLAEKATITYNGFTLDALQPGWQGAGYAYGWWASDLRAGLTISGGSGTQKQGVCLLERLVDTYWSPIACSTSSDCTSGTSPTFNTVAARYCANVNNAGQKYCYGRGATSTWCAGSPVTGTAIGNGTYYSSWVYLNFPSGTSFVSYGCVNGCTGSTSDPSISQSITFM